MAGENDLDAYIDSVADLKSPETVPPDTSSQDVNTGEQDTSDKQDGAVNDALKGADKTQQLDNKQQQQQQKPDNKNKKQSGQQEFTRDSAGNLFDKNGNLVDENGTVLAPKGKAQRIYVRAQRLERQLEETTRRLQEAELRGREVQLLNGIPERYNLTHDEVATALDWAGRAKRGDALGVAKDLVAWLASKGHNVSELLGETAGDSIEIRAVQNLLDQRLGPLQQRELQEQQNLQVLNAARAAMQQFLDDNEYADVHQNEIARLAQSERITPQAAYNRLFQFAAINGLDFSEPLGPQIQERAAQKQQQQQQPSQGQQQQKPLPNGASVTRANGVEERKPQYADPDKSWAEIISEAMNQH